MQSNKNIEPLYRTNLILWAAFLMSQFLFLAVIFFAKKELFNFDFTKSPLGKEPVVILIIGMIALFNFALSFYMNSQMTNEAIKLQRPAGIQTAQILAYALCESISIFGVVLAFIFDYPYFFVLFGLAILGIILHFPKRDSLMATAYKK
jgi:uncharacterized membrane protein